MKKFLLAVIFVFLISGSAFAGFQEHYEAGQAYLVQYQYSSAITEFKKSFKN